jgi:hypothetical protein
MAEPRKHVLVVGKETGIERVAPMLRRAEFSVHSVEPSPFLLDLVLSTAFELVIVTHPLDTLPLDDLVATIRDRGSACRDAGLLLLADPESLDDAQNQVDLGANRAICTEWSEARVLQSVGDLLDIAPRIGLRVLLHTNLAITDTKERATFQTVNVSTSGALLQGTASTNPSDSFSFLFRLPGGGLVEGTAEVVRHTNPLREGVEGVGARFSAFEGASEELLLDHIQRQIDLGDKGP